MIRFLIFPVLLCGLFMMPFFTAQAGHSELADDVILPHVARGDDQKVYFYDTINHCTADGHRAAYHVHGHVPVMNTQGVTDEHLAALKAMYQRTMRPVYEAPLGVWTEKYTVEQVRHGFFVDMTEISAALSQPIDAALQMMGREVTGILGEQKAGPLTIYADELELSAEPIADCPVRPAEDDHFTAARKLPDDRLPHLFTMSVEDGGQGILMYDRTYSCTRDGYKAYYEILTSIPVHKLSDIAASERRALQGIYEDIMRGPMVAAADDWMAANEAAEIERLFPLINGQGVTPETQADFQKMKEIMLPYLVQPVKAVMPEIVNVLKLNLAGAYRFDYDNLVISDEKQRECMDF